jgi:hypothetical protein
VPALGEASRAPGHEPREEIRDIAQDGAPVVRKYFGEVKLGEACRFGGMVRNTDQQAREEMEEHEHKGGKPGAE